jgi:N-acetylglucosaminyl-diphospho-decaprenol L-rhamnosyltransferase
MAGHGGSPRRRLHEGRSVTARVAIIIVTHFSGDHLAACLDSIPVASATPTPTIVIDNATTDDSVRTVVDRYPDVVFIETGENLGYGRAINRAAESLSDDIEWILVTNPDTVFRNAAVDEMLAVGDADARIGSVGPRISNADGTVYPSARALPSLRTGIGHAVFAKTWPSNPWTARYLQSDVYDRPGEEPVTAGWLSGACLLVRRTAFDAVGGFDDRFFMYFEDVDLGRSLGNAGWRNVYVPRASVEHAGGQSTKRYSRRMLVVHHTSAAEYLDKKYASWYLWPLRKVLRFGLFVRSHLAR